MNPDTTTAAPAAPAVTPAVASTVSGINSTVASINAATGGKLPTISVAGLTTPQTAATPVAPAPPSGGAGLGAVIGSTNDGYTAALNAKADNAQGNATDALTAYVKELATKSGTAEQTDQAYATGGVDTAAKDLLNVTNQINAEKEALNHQVLAIKANPTGMLQGGVDSEVQRVTDASLARQADLAVIQSASQGNYSLAKSIADRKVAAAVEGEQNKVDALNATYTANKDIFTTEESHAFTAAQQDRQAAIDEKKTLMTGINDMALTALKNGAPTSVAMAIQNSTTLAEAEGHAGGYLKTPKTGTAAENQNATVSTLTSLINSGRPLSDGTPVLDTTGFITPVAWNTLIAHAPSQGLSREDFVKQFGYLVYKDAKGGIPSSYKISPAEQKLILGTAPTP